MATNPKKHITMVSKHVQTSQMLPFYVYIMWERLWFLWKVSVRLMPIKHLASFWRKIFQLIFETTGFLTSLSLALAILYQLTPNPSGAVKQIKFPFLYQKLLASRDDTYQNYVKAWIIWL